jgi:hypothetical protein
VLRNEEMKTVPDVSELLTGCCETKEDLMRIFDSIVGLKEEKDKHEKEIQNIALKLLADKVDINIIANATDLSVDKIVTLHEKS